MKRFYILDALRFVLALSVAIGHAGVIPLFGSVGQPDYLLDISARIWRTAVYGPGAVIAFFVISGFCIHYPFAARKAACLPGRFYARRYLRIFVPVAATVILFKLLIPSTEILGPRSILWNSTLWSIVCEEIYYAVYPALNLLHRRVGWRFILVPAFVISLGLSAYYFAAVDWQDMGIFVTTLILFPVWLLGCYLAEQVGSLTRIYSVQEIWLWRAGAWGVMWAGLMLHSHTALHQIATGLWIGVALYFWVRAELCYYRDRKPWMHLVSAGYWSYSLYLIHPLVISYAWQHGLQSQSSSWAWLAVMSLVLASSYVFYLFIERPSHHLARRIRLFPGSDDLLEGPLPDRMTERHGVS